MFYHCCLLIAPIRRSVCASALLLIFSFFSFAALAGEKAKKELAAEADLASQEAKRCIERVKRASERKAEAARELREAREGHHSVEMTLVEKRKDWR